MMQQPFYDSAKSYEENFTKGPFGAFADGKTYQMEAAPQHTFLGHKIYTPFGIPAGPVLNSNFVKSAFEMGFDVVHYKTQRSTTFPCNDFPNVLFVDIEGDLTPEKAEKPLVGKTHTKKSPSELSITNSFGNPSKGPEFWVEDLKKAVTYQGNGQLLVMSVVGTIKDGFTDEDYYDDFAKAAELAVSTGVKVIEVNLSCPNVANEGVLCYSPDAVYAICRKVKEKIGNTPLLAKIGYYTQEQDELLKVIIDKMQPFVAGIAAINTIAAPIVDEKGEQALPGPNRLKSGVCGASIKWAGLDMTTRLAALRASLHTEFAIVGVGGVMNKEDYLVYRNAGADLVQSATGAMWHPYLALDIKGIPH